MGINKKDALLNAVDQNAGSFNEVVDHHCTEWNDSFVDAEVLIDSMSSVFIGIDEDGLVSRWNHVAAKVFEIPAAQSIGVRFADLPIDWADETEIGSALESCKVGKQKQVALQFVDRWNITRSLEATICPVRYDLPSTARMILATDITNQTALQTQLDQAMRLESVGQLAAGVAHEINTPMQYIGDNVQFVSKALKKLAPLFDCLYLIADPDCPIEKLSEERESLPDNLDPARIKSTLSQIPEALKESVEGVLSVSKIVAAMKEFSHPGGEPKTEVCINHILESTITVAKNEWKYVADVETDFEVGLPQVGALPSELNQAFLNIVVNAAQAIDDRVSSGDFDRGVIKITTKSTTDHVIVTIEDDGGGIPASARNKVFEPFFTTKPVGKGTGQGLAIAYSAIVHKHGGQLSYTVLDGVGTSFSIEIPRAEVDGYHSQNARGAGNILSVETPVCEVILENGKSD